MSEIKWCSFEGFLGIIVRMKEGRADVITYRRTTDGGRVIVRNSRIPMEKIKGCGRVADYKKEVSQELEKGLEKIYADMRKSRREQKGYSNKEVA
jgi:hypothetical protein